MGLLTITGIIDLDQFWPDSYDPSHAHANRWAVGSSAFVTGSCTNRNLGRVKAQQRKS